MRDFTISKLWGCFIIALLFAAPVAAKDLTASLAQMPLYAESVDKGLLVDLVKAIEQESGMRIKREVVPFARSMDNVINRRADFHMPLIMAPNADLSELNYDFSTETIFHVNFVLFSNKNKPLDPAKLASYKLETDRAHTQYFPFPIEPAASLESAMRKVDAGRIDGFIFADFASEPIIKQYDLKNIHRSLYRVFDVKIILPKGAHGGEVDRMLSAAIRSLREKGDYDKLMGSVDRPYDDWQP